MKMGTMIIKKLARLVRKEDGVALLFAIMLVFLGGLMMPPILNFVSNATSTTTDYQDKATGIYSADAGIEHGIWEIKHNDLAKFDLTNPFDDYDYTSSGARNYTLDQPINDLPVHVTLENVWIPFGIDGNGAPVPPDPTLAKRLVNSGTVKVTSSSNSADREFYIKISANQDKANDMQIQRIGIWLPPSYIYHPGSSTLDDSANDTREYYRNPDQMLDPKHVKVIPFGGGGQVVLWDFTTGPDIPSDHWTYLDSFDFKMLPGVNMLDTRPQATITVKYHAIGEYMIGEPEFISWIDTTDNQTGIPYAWDSDTRLYKITSRAGDAEIEAYTSKTEGQMASTTAGQFTAVGNSSLLDFTWGTDTRELQLDESSAILEHNPNPELDQIPDNASIVAARLYWTGYLEHPLPDNPDAIIWQDDCRTFWEKPDWDDDNNWWNGDGWETNVPSRADASITGGIFKGHGSTDTGDNYLYLTDSIDLSPYAGRDVFISWDQGESGDLEYGLDNKDYLEYAFSNDANASWDWKAWRDNATWHESFHDDNPPQVKRFQIDQSYLASNFRLAFRIQGFRDNGEECYIDDIYIYNLDDRTLWQDDCSSINSGTWNQTGSDWNQSSGRYAAHHSGANENDRYLTMDAAAGLNLSRRAEVKLSWDMAYGGILEAGDNLEYFLWNTKSGTPGVWESQGKISAPQTHVEEIISDSGLLKDFRIMFKINGFDETGEYLYLDNITVSEQVTMLMADNSASLKIDPFGEDAFWAYYDDDGLPASTTDPEEARELVATTIDPERIAWFNLASGSGYGYACTSDVTDIIREYVPPDRRVTFTVGDIDSHCMSQRSSYGGTEFFLGWSLVLVYTSPDTLGHRLIIYDSEDDFVFLGNKLHRDYACSGFVVPQRVTGEEVAATIYAFVAEGDPEYSSPGASPHGDCLTFNDTELLSEYGKTYGVPAYNTWDSRSMLCSNEGVDVETFKVMWDDGLIEEGDTSADVTIWAGNPTDGIAVVYIAMSFRSELNTSGALSYRIK